jgi:FtsP/CotA-like multicopper oxidase with cupredoxin domain
MLWRVCGLESDRRENGMTLRPRDIFIRIEPLERYSPLAPVVCSRKYGRDCMFNHGHELGRVSPGEISASTVDALVYREYLDPHYTIPNRRKIIGADLNEPPWERRVPGAVLWASPGERLYIHVLNADPNDCHSFHLHGLRYGIDSDGAWPLGVETRDGRRSDEILPGQKWTYVFDATEDTIGAWGFHDHVRDVGATVNRGLFGGLIVRDPHAECADHEAPVFVHQMVGSGIACNFVSGTLSPGDTFEITAPNEVGVCRYHCQIHGAAMMPGELHVDPAGPDPRNISAKNNKFNPQVATVRPGGKVIWTNDETEAGHDHIVIADGGGAATYCLNGRAFVGNTPTIVADAGERLRWYLFNLDLGGVWHNFHPHSTRWRLPAPPGGASDVHSLSPVESFVADTEVPRALRLPCELEQLQCDPPEDACRLRLKGDFLFHCHIEEHMMAGLAGLVRAREWVWLTRELAQQLQLRPPIDDGANECPVVNLNRCRPRRRPRPPRGDQPHGDMPGMAGMGDMAGMGGAQPVDLTHAAERGVFELLPCDSQVLAVHAALMHTGKVLFFAGSGNDELYTTGLRSIVWDYENGGFHRPVTPIDVFCAHQSFMGDGRLLVVGGTETYAFTGLRTAYAFDPATEEWIRLADMVAARWYPSAITLGDGRVLAAGGTGDTWHQVEIYSPQAGWASPLPQPHDWGAFPNLVLMRNGRVFFTGAHFDGFARTPFIFDPVANSETTVPGLTPADHHSMAPSVLLPPAQTQRVLVLGGGGGGGPVKNTNLINLTAASPSFAAGPMAKHARAMQNAVILPDRTVFVSGGGSAEDPAAAVLESEIYDPAANAWRVGATALVPRLYHSVALLLPDGRVITAGSNPHRRDDELRLELYHPPYLFRGPRPSIESAPASVTYGERFEIHTPQADDIHWVQLIRPMAVTHSCDNEQRLVDLPISRRRRQFCRLSVTVPNDPNLAPPGWYMLFLTDRDGIPSRANWVHLTA